MIEKLNALKEMTEKATQTTIANDGNLVALADVDTYNDNLEIINDAKTRISTAESTNDSYKDKVVTGKDGAAILKEYEKEYNDCYDLLSKMGAPKEVTYSEIEIKPAEEQPVESIPKPTAIPEVSNEPYKIDFSAVDNPETVTFSGDKFEPDYDAYRKLVADTLDSLEAEKVNSIQLPTEVETPVADKYNSYDAVVSAAQSPFGATAYGSLNEKVYK